MKTYRNDNVLKFQKPETKWDIIIDDNLSLKFITSILNSNLITYYFSKFLSTDTLQGTYSSIYPDDLRQIPIKRGFQQEKNIIAKVDQILSLKKDNPEADTSALEREIDTLVYQLYNLTDEEIAIVEEASK